MGLNALAKTFNIKASIEKYFFDKLKVDESFDIDWEGVKFDNNTVSEWLQPRVLDFTSDYIGHASSTEYGEQTDVLFQVNIFVKKTDTSISYRHYEIRDLVVNYFKIGQEITIADHANDNQTAITYMKVRGIEDDGPLPETQYLYQYIISFRIDYTKATTNP